MKRVLSAVVFSSLSSAALAVAPGGDDCGWGNMLFEGQSGLPAHVVASIVNATSGNASLGMTSGTNGCSANGTLTYGGDSLIALGTVMDEFSEDVAVGEGEALSAVAVSMGIAPEDRQRFKAVMHENYSQLFPHANVKAEEVMTSINAIMKQDEVLAKYAA